MITILLFTLILLAGNTNLVSVWLGLIGTASANSTWQPVFTPVAVRKYGEAYTKNCGSDVAVLQFGW